MFFLRYVMPLVLLSVAVGFVAAWLYGEKQAGDDASFVADLPAAVEPVSRAAPAPTSVTAPRVSAAPDFVDQINAAVSATSATATATATPSPAPDTEAVVNSVANATGTQSWTVESFLDAMSNKPQSVRVAAEGDIAAQIESAVAGGGVAAPTDDYLSAISGEARNTTVIEAIAGDPNRFKVTDTVTGKYRIITVKPGESLSQIAQRIYGDALDYERIYEANDQQLSDPDRLSVGQQLVIPVDE